MKTVWPVRDTASQWSLLSLCLSGVTVGTNLEPSCMEEKRREGREERLSKKYMKYEYF